MSSRTDKRRHFADDIRIALLEDDVDAIERTGQRMAKAVNRLMVALVGASLSIVVASLLLAADIARGH